ncbi:MAG TPA: SDR family NAD(P)-dependent oxidoreductase [Actinomycetota bacterium]|nr:SDR family NAD(P)-dependent oxidoreductase [Actinomycetota bacterium]
MAGERIAVITGASSGIGAASARQLARAGFHVVAGARRTDRLQALAEEVGATTLALDVTDPASVTAFAAAVRDRHGHADLLVNNAGTGVGLDPVAEGRDHDWQAMMDTNVVGLLRVTRTFLPLLRAAPHAHIVNLGSIAGFEVYPGGAGYTASKHAVRAITDTLRLELNGEPIRVTEIAPGMVETEFSVIRFRGDTAKADDVYAGVQPLTADDIADCITWAVTRPPHVDIDFMVVRPVAQAASYKVARNRS